jgi:hypothetical protein
LRLEELSIFFRDPIRKLDEDVRQRLRAQQITSADKLANQALTQPAFLTQFNVDTRRQLLEIIAQVVARRSRSLIWPQLRRHTLDLVVLVVMLAVGAALWRDYHLSQKAIAIAGPSGILPFHVIRTSDLASKGPKPTDGFADVVGRYSAEYVPPGSRILVEKLSQGPRLTAELNDRFLVRLKVQTTNLFAGMNPPFRAALQVAPHERGTGALVLNDVFVLDMQEKSDGPSAVLAVLSADESTLAAFMARSDFFLVARQR